MKKTVAAAILVAALCATGCSASSIEGTWYSYDIDTEELSTLTFEENGTVYDGETGISADWKESDDTVTLSNAFGSMAYIKEGDALVDVSDPETAYFKDEESAAEHLATMKKERADACAQQADAAVADATEKLIGTWESTFTDSTVVFNVSNKHSRYRQSTGLVPAVSDSWYRE